MINHLITLLVLITLLSSFVLSDVPLMYPIESCGTAFATSYNATQFWSNCGITRFTDTGPAYPYVLWTQRDSHTCGVCFELTGPLGSIRTMATIYCHSEPVCSETGDPFRISISEETYPLLLPPLAGPSLLTYRQVSCDWDGPAQYVFTSGSKPTFWAIIIIHHVTGIGLVEVQVGSQWVEVDSPDHTPGYLYVGEPLPFPYVLRVTDFFGDAIEFEVSEILVDVPIDLPRQFFVPENAYDYDGTCCSRPEVVGEVYSDGQLHGEWEDWGGPLRDLEDETFPHSGTMCFRLDYSDYSSMQLHTRFEVLVSQWDYLELYARTDSGSFGGLVVKLGSDEFALDSPPITESWTRYEIDINGRNPDTEFFSLQFTNPTAASATIFLDDIRMVPVAPGEAPDISECAPGVNTEIIPPGGLGDINGVGGGTNILAIALGVGLSIVGLVLLIASGVIVVICCFCRRKKEGKKKAEKVDRFEMSESYSCGGDEKKTRMFRM